MPGHFRLTRADFKGFSTRNPRRIRGAHFSLAIIPLSTGGQVKIACVVSKKAARKASDRNRIKRRFREVLRQFAPHIKKPLALVFYASASSNNASFEELRQDIIVALKNIP